MILISGLLRFARNDGILRFAQDDVSLAMTTIIAKTEESCREPQKTPKSAIISTSGEFSKKANNRIKTAAWLVCFCFALHAF
jgi:hypothetical protein